MADDLAPEIQRRQSNLEQVAAYFKARPNQWILAVELEHVGGRQAWRSRVAECRTKLQMTVENKQDRCKMPDGSYYVESSYRYLPDKPLGRSAETEVPKTLFDLHPRG